MLPYGRPWIALIDAGNTASRHLHERYGFSTVGTIPQAGEKLGQILDLTLNEPVPERTHDA